jgi:EpsI family protein
MNPISLKHIFIGISMLVAAGLALALTPREKVADQGPKIDLETMIPKEFGDWKLDSTVLPLQAISPSQKATLERIYSQTLSRTYVNSSGRSIMLSMAYGGDQSDEMQVHKPEVCYPAQGFQVVKEMTGDMLTRFGMIPVKRLVATQGNRIEPITYWITIGNSVPRTSFERKLEQLHYGLTGKIPDGMLVRISSINSNDEAAYQDQAEFVKALLSSMPAEDRERIMGVIGA